MISRRCLLKALLLACACTCVLAHHAMAVGDEMARDLRAIDPGKHIEKLASIPSRVTGYPGCTDAANYVYGYYKDVLGLADVRMEENAFQVVVPMDRGAELQVGQGRVPLHCVWPNYVRTPKTTDAGLRGRLIWGGSGELADFAGKDVQGAVVLMEFDSATRWLNAAKLGAAAVVFVEPDVAFRSDAEQKYSTVPIPVPRYYLRREDLVALAGMLGGEGAPEEAAALALVRSLGSADAPSPEATVVADMIWDERTVYAVSGVIPGIDPDLGKEVVVCEAYYDSCSVVPALSPGAENACGIAAQLEIASFLSKHPPRRTVKFLAVPGHFQALAGARHYAFKQVYPRRKEVSEDESVERGGEPDFFIGLDLSSRQRTLAGFYKGHFYDQLGPDELRLQQVYSEYSGLLLEWARELGGSSTAGAALSDAEFQSGIVPQHGRGWRALLPDRTAFDAEVIGMSQRPAITLATTGDVRNTVNTPLDTYEDLEPFLGNVRAQAVVCAYLVKMTADAPALPVRAAQMWAPDVAGWKLGSVMGRAIEQTLSDYIPQINVPDAVTCAELSAGKSMMGVQCRTYVRSDVQGLFEIYGIKEPSQAVVDGFLLSSSSGSVSKVSTRGLVAPTRRKREEWDLRRTDLRMNFFAGVCTTVFDLVDPLRLMPIAEAQVLRGESNSDEAYLVSFIGGDVPGTGYSEPAACFYTPKGRLLKVLFGGAGTLLNVKADLAAEEGEVRRADAEVTFNGTGYPAERAENFIYRTAFAVARDQHLLDYYRLDTLARRGIRKKNIWELHREALAHLLAASGRLKTRDYPAFYREANTAWALENRVYPDVRGTSRDVVKGVIFYFALLLPFVIFAERLLLGLADIRKKLAAIGGIFALSYVVLMLVHPAFRLSQAPIIILCGFFMMAASLWTVWYLIGKFQGVMEQVKRHIDTIHRADVARASAAMAAFVLGISNMRKRKVRTILTAVTLILLTFTILSFTSFETMPAYMLQRATDRQAAYQGLLMRRLSWDPMSEFTGYELENFFGTQGMTVAPRSWFVSQEKTKELEIEVRSISSSAGGRQSVAMANAVLGLSPQQSGFWSGVEGEGGGEQAARPADGPLPGVKGNFDPSVPGWPFVCILPTGMLESLGMDPGRLGDSYVSVLGRRLRVVGVLDTGPFSQYKDLDGETLTPVYFQEQQYQQGAAGGAPALTATGGETAEEFISKRGLNADEVPYVHMDAERVLVVPHELCMKLGGSLRAVAVMRPAGQAALGGRSFEQVVREFAGRATMPLYMGAESGLVNLVATRSRLSVGGLKGLVVPVLIAALIVFNTMLGAVYERVTEIKVYAAVGLAPIHIASLFLAESCVFAVVGAMMGYLVGQVVSFGLMQVPWLMEGISLNYSSISAVWSAMLVIVVVVGSTAYPARMAGKLSVPDETRRMTIAPPTSDLWEIRFPFTVSSTEALGVMAYLKGYFESNDEDSVGTFTADNIGLRQEPDPEGQGNILVLEADIWVAPLDMGISQNVNIAAVPDPEEREITYLFFSIARKSGEFQTWARMNMRFLKDLRKQLLIWRLVTPEAKVRLTAESRAAISAPAAEGRRAEQTGEGR